MNKEQKQKVILAAILGLGGLYVYFSLLLGPLATRETAAQKEIAQLEPMVKKARTQIRATQAIQESDPNAERAAEIRETVRTSVPEGAAIVWFPSRIGDFFYRHGMEKVSTRPTQEANDSLFPEYQRTTWEVSLNEVAFGPFAAAVAGLENEQALLQIQSLHINTVPSDVERQQARLLVSTLVKP